MRSPPSVTHCIDGYELGLPWTVVHRAGVEHTCVARVAPSSGPNEDLTADRGGRQSVAPTSSAVQASPMHGSKETADASRTRLLASMPCACALACA